MIEHLRKYIGLYLAGLICTAIYFDDPNDDYPMFVWIFALLAIIFLAPPFLLKERIAGLIYDFYEWLFLIPMRWLKKSPKWFQYTFVIIMIILFEEFIFAPLGYTMYPWRMDFKVVKKLLDIFKSR